MIHTLKCPSCGAPVDYEDENDKRTFRCPFCNNTIAVPAEFRRKQESQQIHLSFNPQVGEGVKKAGLALLIIPIAIIAFVGIIIAVVVFNVTRSTTRSISKVTPPQINFPNLSGLYPGSSPGKNAENSIATLAMKFGSKGTGPGYFEDARSIAVDGEGRIYVGEYTGGRIQVFDSAGKFVTQWMADTEMPLRGLAAARDGTVYIVQRGEILKYEGPTGKPLGKVAFAGGNGFDDVTVLADGSLLAAWVRASGDDIVRLDRSGNPTLMLRKAISSQSRRSELDMHLAADGVGNIYALGTFNRAVFKFSPDGRYQTRFGSSGDQPGQFGAPSAIAVDNQSRVYVTDFKGIQVFDADGRYIDVFDVEGAASGLVFNDKNELFVVARTQVFKFTLK